VARGGKKKWVVEFVAAFVAASLLVVTAYRTLKDSDDDPVLWLLFGVVAFLTLGSVFYARTIIFG